jgi:uncharacterized protein YcbX
MLTVSALYIYPIKSLGGIALSNARVTDRGFEYDRRWMLIDENHVFISQREYTQMALLHVELDAEGLRVSYKTDGTSITIPFIPQTTETARVTVWDDSCDAMFVSPVADEWFSDKLNMKCRLVYMPDDSQRKVEEKYAKDGEITSFSDGYPFLLIGQSSLDDLNSRVSEKLPMNRFRPNIVFTGASPYTEDTLKKFSIGSVKFKGLKLCARCVMTTVDQETAIKNKEPLKTLATYRRKGNKILFGQNLVHEGVGYINIGDELTNIGLHENDERFMV